MLQVHKSSGTVTNPREHPANCVARDKVCRDLQDPEGGVLQMQMALANDGKKGLHKDTFCATSMQTQYSICSMQ